MVKSASAKAIKRPLRRMAETVAQEEGIIQGQVFTDDVLTGKLVDESNAGIDDTIPALLEISVGDALVPRPIPGVIAVESLPTSLESELTDEAIEQVHAELFPEEDEAPEFIEIAGEPEDEVSISQGVVSTLTPEGPIS